MPIYAYRCATCGHAQDVLQKMSDPLLTVCPNCGKPTFQKQVTAAGFQLKGSGWYVTDFRGDKSTATAPPKGGEESAAKGGDGKASAEPSSAAGDGAAKKGDGASTSAAPSPAPAPSAAPAAPSPAPASGKPNP